MSERAANAGKASALPRNEPGASPKKIADRLKAYSVAFKTEDTSSPSDSHLKPYSDLSGRS